MQLKFWLGIKRLAIVAAAFAVLILPVVMFAASAEDLRKKITERETEIKKLETEIAEHRALLERQEGTSQTLNNEIKRLETQIKKLDADIKLAEHQIQKTSLRIEELAGEITVHAGELDKNLETLTQLLQTLNASDDETLIETFLAHDRLADFFSDRESTMQIQKAIDRAISELKRKKAVLEEERQSREREEQEYTLFKKDLSGKKVAKESINQNKSKLLRESKNQESRYQQILKGREERRKLISQELESIEEELRRLIDPSLLPTKRSGVLGWPVERPVITQGFGKTDFANTAGSDVYNGGGHNGVDFRASPGTRILAAEAGLVKDAGNTDAICPGGSYGKWIIVEHSNNLSTLYAHLSAISVSKGTNITRGNVIGYSGSTGYVTGPHLHFTVYATNTYQLRKTKHCGLIPAGGYLNPLDYL